MTELRVWPGKSYPLGTTWDGEGVNFALFSEHAASVELLLFTSPDDHEPRDVIPLKERDAFIWHGYIHGLGPGQMYLYRVDGPYEPEKGQRFNASKALLDPYAKAIAGGFIWDERLLGYGPDSPEADLSRDNRDSCAFVPKCVVVDPSFDWEGDRLLRIPWNETVIYETHVKGFTMQHPGVEDGMRGTYAGLACHEVMDYFRNLGITAVELLPVHHHMDEGHLRDKGLTNYWGYNTVGYFAPDFRYSRSGILGGQVREFKEMVKTFHRAGIEVILDVVYNHTAEGGELGPTVSFRGIDNAVYYHLRPEAPRYYMDFTGVGNTLNTSHPHVTRMIMDSLRYWVLEMHVDGFRFDLASALARELYEVDYLSAFFDIIHQDPVVSQVKLIAEPWDLGEGGYQVGNFPPLWTEWNGRYRDTMRRFWKGDKSHLAEIGYRLSGSSDLYQDDGRLPLASVNFITCHDGFTLNDLVSYNEKHNKENQENNEDGSNDNLSWNCGTEGPTDDQDILDLRERQKKNFIATLFLSQGVPMLLGGDEAGRTQKGNNNAYCQDNEISWYDWNLGEPAQRLLEFTRKVIRLRRDHPNLRRKNFFQGQKLCGSDVKDLTWFKTDGSELNEADWEKAYPGALGMRLSGQAIEDVDEQGRRITDNSFLLFLNPKPETVSFKIPVTQKPWNLVLYTCRPEGEAQELSLDGGAQFELQAHSLALFESE